MKSKSYSEIIAKLESLRSLPKTPVTQAEIFILATIARNNESDMMSAENQFELLDTIMYCFSKYEPMGEAARNVYEILFT